MGESRMELLLLELQEERERLLRVILMALGAAVFGLLTGVGVTIAVVLFFWESSPLLAVSLLTLFYAASALGLYAGIARLQRDWQTLPGTLEQLKKDLECVEELLD